MIATQAAELGLYAWYEHWAQDTFRFGFRKNYAIAIAVVCKIFIDTVCP
jgi:hypothetical protein